MPVLPVPGAPIRTRLSARRTNSKSARPRICALFTPAWAEKGKVSIVHCQGSRACATRLTKERSRWNDACSLSNLCTNSAPQTPLRSARSSSVSSTRAMPLKFNSCSNACKASRGVCAVVFGLLIVFVILVIVLIGVVVIAVVIKRKEVARHMAQHQSLQARQIKQAVLERLLQRRQERLCRIGTPNLQQPIQSA